MDYDYLLKLMLIGDSGTGKTCLLDKFVNDNFESEYLQTIGYDIKTKIKDRIKLEILDMSGQEHYDDSCTSKYREPMGIIVVYDITKPETFKNVSQKWLPKIKKLGKENVLKMIVGSKCDLEDQRQVPTAHGNAVAKQLGVRFLEVSPKDSFNVDKAFMDLARAVVEKTLKRKRK